VGQRPLAFFPISAGSLSISTRSSHATRRFRQSCMDLHRRRHVCLPSPRRRCRRARLAVLLCSIRTQCVVSLDFRSGFRPLLILISILLVCCTQFELILRSRSDRASNDVSMYPRRSPTPTRRGPPRIPSSGVAVSNPCRLIPSQTDANTEYMLSHDAGSPADWPCYRARRPPVPSRLDLAPRCDLITNAALLAVHGVRYPKHPLGPNGIPAVAFALHQAVTTAVWIEVILSFSNEGSSSRVEVPGSS
jgi:hypothetical protein